MNLSAFIDHTLLKPQATRSDIDQLCAEAVSYGFAAVCLPPVFVRHAVRRLADAPTIQVATVVGFPVGYTTRSTKVYEINNLTGKGATEIDMVVNIGAVKDKRWRFVEREIAECVRATHKNKALLKVIIETGLLDTNEIMAMCAICADKGVDFVKTSTGFNGGGATLEVVQLMRKILPENIHIKASGGIATRRFALQLIEAGARRIGSSKSLEIMGQG